MDSSSRSTGTKTPASRFRRTLGSLPLPVKLALAVVSASSYLWVDWLAERVGDDIAVFGDLNWPPHLIAVIFAVLVMAPYAAASRQLWLRVFALCVASVFIYHFAVAFVVDGPFGYSSIMSFLVSGAGAALLVGIAVVVLVPRPLPWLLPVYCLVAGVIGGAAFEDSVWAGSGCAEIGGHLAWQVLVCLALHLGLRPAPR